MLEFPICKTDTEKDNSFNEFSSEVQLIQLILCSLLKILLSEGLLCITESSLSFILWNITKFPCYLVQKYCNPI